LTFKQAEVSDVLKSLTVLDLDGGHVTAVSYDSTKPVEQLLAEIALSIPDEDSLTGLLPQLKGARVTAGPESGSAVEGTLLGVDTVEVPGEKGVARRPRLSLLTDAGEVRTFDLYQVRLALLDAGLRRDLEFYLRTQLSAKKKDARTFTLFAEGQGRRRVRMSYVLEAPVWKATYRILLNEEDRPPLIQGWAVADNTQDEDWEEVSLSLVAGLPVSFVHDLYTPRYIRRPVVAVRETTGVLPPEVEAGAAADAEPEALLEEAFFASAGGKMRQQSVRQKGAFMGAAAPGAARPSAVSSTPARVRERQVGDLLEYTIERPVTIRRNQSALVPIVLKPFNGRSVLLYQKAGRPENPMRCVEFENSTGLTLEGGPVTVLDAGSYVGEAMLDTMKPGEQRLVPYAVELGVRVLDNIDSHTERVQRVVIRKGHLYTHAAQVETTTYTFVSKSDRDEVLYLDHPRGGRDWELIEPGTPHETTENYWRFRLMVPKRQTTKFVVKSRHTFSKGYSLQMLESDLLGMWLEQRYLDRETEAVLREVVELRHRRSDVEKQLQMLKDERTQIHEEQKRIRENLQSLGDRASEKELRERFVRTLNAQEDRLEQIEREQKEQQRRLDECRAKISEVLAKLEYEGPVK
ncbi:MAG TPA: hypothetical protein VIL46_05630, partial [Gemmataceae bacterium]